jgi:hypothetical protein
MSVTLKILLFELNSIIDVILGRLERQQRENGGSITVLKNSLTELEARMCNGVYLWRITGYDRHLENARENVVTALHSPPFYTNVYGYKLCLRYVYLSRSFMYINCIN